MRIQKGCTIAAAVNNLVGASAGKPIYRSLKRAFDILCAAIGMVGTSPLWLVAVIGIKASDPGPVFYRARRIGKDNQEFTMWKFRSMRVERGADESSLRADTDRIFPFGEFARASKVDELPQLINILNGTMSIIGPRPASVDQVAITRAGRNAIAAEVPCGLSGPSALYDYIVGDAITDEAEYAARVLPTRLALDVYYVQNMSAFYDLKMIWQTLVCIASMMCGRIPQKILDELLENAKSVDAERIGSDRASRAFPKADNAEAGA